MHWNIGERIGIKKPRVDHLDNTGLLFLDDLLSSPTTI